MPIISRRLFKNNIVKNAPSLPIPITLGSLSVTKNFEGHPTASINYEGITEKDISRYKGAYNPHRSSRIIIDGIPFRVAPDGGYSYSRTGYVYREKKQINVYTVSINLEGWWKILCSQPVKIKPLVDIKTGRLSASKLASKAKVSLNGGFDIWVEEVGGDTMMSLDDVLEEYARVNGCYIDYGSSVSLKKADSGSTYSFSWEEQISDGSNQLGVAPYYNGAELTWTPRQSQDPTQLNLDAPPEYEQKDPVLKTESEYEQEITSPPKGTSILRSLDSNLDQSGPKKVRRTTYTIDGQVDREIVETWGFAYYLKDFTETPDGLMILKPWEYWKLIEYQETKYYYRRLEPLAYQLKTPQSTDDISYQIVIHPDYEKIVQYEPLKGIKFMASKAKYLTEIVTSGWKLARFKQEEEGGDTDTSQMKVDENGNIKDPWWPVVRFSKVSRQDVTMFHLKSMRADYEQDTVPYSVEWTDWVDFDPEMKRLLFSKINPPKEGSARKLRVGLITADMDYVEPMLVWTESRQASSIAVMANPDSTEEDPLPAFVAGEESYYQSIWTKRTEEYSTEKIVELTASGAGFVDGVENIRYREIQGRPPEAQYRKRAWEEKKPTDQPKPEDPTKTIERYFLYSDSIPEWSSEGGESLSFSAASTLEEALLAAKTQLKINTLQSTQESRTVSWHFPTIEGGDFCTFRGDKFAGRFRVLSASYTLQFDGTENIYGLDTICTTEGTQLTLGLWDNRTVRVDTREEDVKDSNATDKQGEDPPVDKNVAIITLGGILPSSLPNRRN